MEDATVDLQRGSDVDTNGLVAIFEGIHQHMSGDMNCADKLLVYLFIMSILSSESEDNAPYFTLPYWGDLMEFTFRFDRNYWTGVDV